jgi:hypothetical protein
MVQNIKMFTLSKKYLKNILKRQNSLRDNKYFTKYFIDSDKPKAYIITKRSIGEI